MKQLTKAAVERAMKLQDVMLRAMAKRITWFQAAEILGISCRQMGRWKTRFEHEGYEGLFDRRLGVPQGVRRPQPITGPIAGPITGKSPDLQPRPLCAVPRSTITPSVVNFYSLSILNSV